MTAFHEPPRRAYVNVMEILVAEEVDKQLKSLSQKVSKYVKRLEVETYALNRLPPLYASSEKGWQHQYEKAKRTHNSQISKAVMQAMAAVQVDPIRSSQPLSFRRDDEAQSALKSLRDMLRQPDLSWDGIITRLQPLLGVGKPELTSPAASPVPSNADGSPRHYWRPGTYGSENAWKSRSKSHEQGYDWNDPRYCK